jgi:hypothetical protein
MTGYVPYNGGELAVRVDVNVIGAVEEKYGSLKDFGARFDKAADILWLAAEMANEAAYAAGSPVRLTPKEIGAKVDPSVYGDFKRALLAVFVSSFGGDIVSAAAEAETAKKK